jgi:hypothetical protein
METALVCGRPCSTSTSTMVLPLLTSHRDLASTRPASTAPSAARRTSPDNTGALRCERASGRRPLESERRAKRGACGVPEESGNQYTRDSEARGCLVFGAARIGGTTSEQCCSPELAKRRRSEVRRYVASTHLHVADEVAGYVLSVMWGPSASARQGLTKDRLNAVARASAAGMATILSRGS